MDKVSIVFSYLYELWLTQPIITSFRYKILVHGLVFRLSLENFIFWWDLHAVGFVVPRLWCPFLILTILICLLFCILLDASYTSLRQLYLLVILLGRFNLIIVLNWNRARCRLITLILLGEIICHLFELIVSTWRTSATSSHVNWYRILILCPIFHPFYFSLLKFEFIINFKANLNIN